MVGKDQGGIDFDRDAGKNENPFDDTVLHKNEEESLWIAWVGRERRKSRCSEVLRVATKHGKMGNTTMEACHL
jgi:hypothetical protein